MSEKVRVIEVFDSLEISGGVQSMIMNTFRAVDKNLIQMDFAVYDAPKENSYEDEIRASGSKVFKIDNISKLGVMGFYKQLVKLFKENPYDIVHAHNLLHNGIILLAAKKAGVNVRISHSHQAFDERNNTFPRNLIAYFFKRLNLDVATKRVACSDLAAEFLYGKNKEYIFLPNAVDLSRFEIEKTKQVIKKEFGIDNQFVLLNIGRFCFQKNQFFLIDIIKKLRKENVVLIIAGEGELKEKFLNKVREEGLEDKIKYIGLTDKIPELLSVTDCMLLPSIYEGLPVVGVEAQAAGCYSILSDNITRLADLGVGLVDYLGINSADIWVKRIKELMEETVSVSKDEIHKKMRELKFDSKSNLYAWYELYGKKLKVIEVFDSLEISGGVQSMIMNTFRAIDKSFIQMDFAVYDAPKENSYEDEITASGSKVFKIGNISRLGIIGFYKQLVKLFKANPYDIVHAHNLLHNGIILLAAKKTGVKVRISHSHQSFDERNNTFPRNLIAYFFKKLNLDVATKRVACSDLAAEFLYGKNKDYIFLPNAIDLSRFEIEGTKRELKDEFNIGNNFVLLHIGRFTKIKNQFFLIDIMKKLKNENYILIVAGEGELKEKFLNKIKEEKLEDKIKYIGLTNKVPKLLSLSDCMLLPSFYEGFAVVTIEAQAAGCYSILSDSITRLADLGVGLTKYLSIESADLWADEIRKLQNTEISVSKHEIHKKMRELKFDSKSNLDAWYELYGIERV